MQARTWLCLYTAFKNTNFANQLPGLANRPFAMPRISKCCSRAPTDRFCDGKEGHGLFAQLCLAGRKHRHLFAQAACWKSNPRHDLRSAPPQLPLHEEVCKTTNDILKTGF